LGLGTSIIEDIRSYLLRIAFLLEISVARLISLIAPPGMNDGPRLVAPARSSAGLGYVALALAEALGRATTLSFRELTMLPFRHVFSPKDLIRSARAWCQMCLEEMDASGIEPYEARLWSIRKVVACPRHRVRLVTRCPRCFRSSYHLVGPFHSGFCGSCGAWLGRPEPPFDGIITDNELRDAINIAELLHRTGGREVEATVLADRLNDCLASFRSIVSMARLAGLSTVALSRFLDGAQKPTLPALIRLCRLRDLPLTVMAGRHPSTRVRCSEIFSSSQRGTPGPVS